MNYKLIILDLHIDEIKNITNVSKLQCNNILIFQRFNVLNGSISIDIVTRQFIIQESEI